MITETDSKPETLMLGRIAHWYAGTILNEKSKAEIEAITTGIVRASVPILQRGLVWKPQQIEMLWDSLLRGFPVGALVLCLKIKGQVKESDDKATHHILDGQQRCNAISLGFTDPFPEGFQEHQRELVPSILWLDLNPTKHDSGTRQFFARLTTASHPWGFWHNDNADRISANDKRKALEDVGKPTSKQGYKRPLPIEMSPYFSNAPVPLAWLMSADVSSCEKFRAHINARLDNLKTFGFKWVSKTIEFIANDKDAVQTERIYEGIVRARNATIVALMAPKGLLDETARESHDNGLETTQNRTDISNIEHLFQRLNRQGTQLDGEELAYSMIKAYWPKLAKPVDEMKQRHMPASRIVALAVRVAMADDAKDHFPPALGVSQIRALANKQDSRIIAFISGNRQVEDSPLFKANAQVDKWLRYSTENPSGFLPVQITRFAMSSPDVYLLLLWMAHRTMDNMTAQENLKKPVQALASWIHWFAIDKSKAANCIYAECNKVNSFSTDTLKEAIRIALENNNPLLAALPSREKLADFMRLPQSDMDKWDWWNLVNDEKGQIDESRKHVLEQVVFRIIGNKEILLYAQRGYLNRQFENYDPCEKDMWQDYNCPWDYDHILAHYYVYYQRGGFQKFSAKWVNSIGNFRAWPAEENRSSQIDLAKDKIKTDEDRIASFLLKDNEDAKTCEEKKEIQVFSNGPSVKDEQIPARDFANACWKRIIRIYREWYDSVGIADLLPTNTKSPAIPKHEPGL